MRRTLIQTLILLLGLCAQVAGAGAVKEVVVKAVRLWPSPENSRITFELSDKVIYKYLRLKNPERLALDLQGVEPEGVLQELAARVSAEDPLIASIRVAKNRPGVTRVVVQLKTEVRPQVFELKPMGEYGSVWLLISTAPPLRLWTRRSGRRPTRPANRPVGIGWRSRPQMARFPMPKRPRQRNLPMPWSNLTTSV